MPFQNGRIGEGSGVPAGTRQLCEVLHPPVKLAGYCQSSL